MSIVTLRGPPEWELPPCLFQLVHEDLHRLVQDLRVLRQSRELSDPKMRQAPGIQASRAARPENSISRPKFNCACVYVRIRICTY